jgi:ectoine hydroxylase-related dioxygenase (phytanoyl-CoA dioxygenase family)
MRESGNQAPPPWPSSCPSLKVMWSLTDSTAQNGGTVFVSSSHHTRHSPTAGRTALHPQECSLVAPAGFAILFQSGTWLGQGANTSADMHRMAASFGYTPTYWRRPEGMWPDVERAVAATIIIARTREHWST